MQGPVAEHDSRWTPGSIQQKRKVKSEHRLHAGGTARLRGLRGLWQPGALRRALAFAARALHGLLYVFCSRQLPLACAAQITREEVRQRIFSALEMHVLGPHNKELRSYFDTLVEQCASPFTGAGDDDAISSSSDEELEQMALLFCKFDRDGDGLLNSDEFAAVVELVVGQTGQQFTHEHVVRCFHDCDVDASGAVDFNELLRYRRQGAL